MAAALGLGRISGQGFQRDTESALESMRGVSRVVISFVINLRSMLSGYWGLGVKYRGHFRVGVGSSRDHSGSHS